MRKIENIEDIHKLALKILLAFDAFCSEHDLKYSLGAGTLLGAVRHRGFIPWDDDIDLFMLRSEYDILLSFAKSGELIQGRYKIKSPFDEDMPYPFIKVIDTRTKAVENRYSTDMGLWLDVFPVDFCGNTVKEAESERKRSRIYCDYLFNSFEKKSRRINSLKILIKEFSFFFVKKVLHINGNYFKKKILSRKQPHNKTKYAGTIVNSITEKDIYPSEFFTEGYDTLIFEGCEFPVFKHYTEILSWRYGDYMKLPPKEDRIPHLAEVYIND